MQRRIPDPLSVSCILSPCGPPPVTAAAEAPSMAGHLLSGFNHAPMIRGPHHRRVRSELAFRLPDDLDLGSGNDQHSAAAAAPTGSLALRKTTSSAHSAGSGRRIAPHAAAAEVVTMNIRWGEGAEAAADTKPRHCHIYSVYSSSILSSMSTREGVFGEVMEAKRAMTPEQLAELADVDPKRAKRETQLNYRQKMQNSSCGHKLWNNKLNCEMHFQALRQEVDRLIIAKGEISNSDTYNLGVQPLPFNPSFFTLPQQQQFRHRAIQLQSHFEQSQSGIANCQMIGHQNSTPNGYAAPRKIAGTGCQQVFPS